MVVAISFAVACSFPAAVISTCLATGCRLSATHNSLYCWLNVNLIIRSLPLALLPPEKSKPQRRRLRRRNLDVRVLHSHRCRRGSCVLHCLPFVVTPMQRKRRRGLHAQQSAGGDGPDLPIHLPYFDYRAWLIVAISLSHRLDQIEYPVVHNRTQQFYILRVRPHQGNGRSCRSSEGQEIVRHVRPIPNLFRNKPDAGGEILDGAQVKIDIAPRRQFVGGTLARQQRPRASHAPVVKRPAVVALPVPVMVVALPAWPLRGVDLQNGIHNFQGVLDERIASFTNAKANQFEEAWVDDLIGWIPEAISRTLIGQHQFAPVGILIATVALRTVCRIDANIVARDAGHQRSFLSDGPLLDMGLEEVGVGAYKFSAALVPVRFDELGGTDQRRNVAGQCGRGITRGFLPAFLGRRRSFANEIATSPHHGYIRIEVAECVGFP